MNGYITFVNNNEKYLKLTDILVESVLNFSDFKIEVFSINFDYKHSSDNVLTKRINLDFVNFETICYSKLFSSFNTTFNNAIQLDSDMIITKYTDKLFKNCENIINLPLGSLHPKDPNNQKNVMDYVGVNKKTQPYLHATYILNDNCKWFFKECYELSNTLMKKNIRPINFDETIYNVMLWKYNCNKYVDCYDPYYEVFLDNKTMELHGYKNMNINNYICHGIKDINHANFVLQKIRKDYEN